MSTSSFRRMKVYQRAAATGSLDLFNKRMSLKDLPAPLETDVLAGVLKFLRVHPLVAWVGRVNRGGAVNENGQYVAFNDIVGCSDVIGQLRSGHFLAIEVKAPGKKPTAKQRAFLALVSHYGGCAGYATSIDDVDVIFRAWKWQAGR